MRRFAAAALLVATALAACTRPAGALNEAVKSGDVERVRALIADGAHVGENDAGGVAPLVDAVLADRVEIASLLMDHGAGADAVNTIDSDLLTKFVPRPREHTIRVTPLMVAAMVGNEAMVRLLLDRGAPVYDAGEDGFTALHAAAVAGRPEIARLLVERGAPVEAIDERGHTAIDVAQFLNETEVVRALGVASQRLPMQLIDVAGHYTLAARADSTPLGKDWTWSTMPIGVTVDSDGSVYWSQYRTDSIHRVDVAGKHRETIATAIDGPLDVAVDRDDELFFTTDRHFPRTIGTVRKGVPPRALVRGTRVNRPFGIVADKAAGMLYWTESINGRVRAASTNGTNVETFHDDGITSENERPGARTSALMGLAFGPTRGLLVWADVLRGEIVRTRLDGSGMKTILDAADGIDVPIGVIVDPAAGKIYWSDPGTESIRRADLDGSKIEVFASSADGVLEPYGMAIDVERRFVYWTDVARDAIYRSSLDRPEVRRFVDLDRSEAARAAPRGKCEEASAGERRELLRHWVKRVRTCLVKVAAIKAVMRHASDFQLAAATCARQLAGAGDSTALRAALKPHCDAAHIDAAVEGAMQTGTGVIAADLPRAAEWLGDVRPFIATQAGAEPQRTADALAALDDLVGRLARADRAPAARGAWTLTETGQRTAYKAAVKAGPSVAPVPVPDDGTVRNGARLAYVDNGDGTITDSNTGLTWEKKCDGCGGLHDVATPYPWKPVSGSTDVHAWLRKVNAEGGAGFAKQRDWRLPTLDELLTIIDYEVFNPAVDRAFQGAACGLGCDSPRAPACSCTELSHYWTSTPLSREGDLIAAVGMNLGFVAEWPVDEKAFARAVRGPTPGRRDRFVDNGDGTVTDRLTRLMWEKKVRRKDDLHDSERLVYWSYDGREETIWDWIDTVNREGEKGFAGHDDWRIPNVKELATIFDPSRTDPHIDPSFFRRECEDIRSPDCSHTAPRLHWTSTTFSDFPAHAMVVGFGGVVVDSRMKTALLAVRAVRGPIP